MKNGMKTGLRMLAGAIFGFTVAYLFMNKELWIDGSALAYPVSLILAVASVSFIAATIYFYFTIRKTASKDWQGEEEDLAEGRMYRQYSDATLTNNLALILSLSLLSLIVITGQPVWLAVPAIGSMIGSFIMASIMPGLMKKMYPERQFPSISDKDYADKLLKMSDDGERHVMLGGLYKTYMSMNTLLFGAIFLLLIYSMASGTSQLMGIFAIAAVLVVGHSKYLVSIRKK